MACCNSDFLAYKHNISCILNHEKCDRSGAVDLCDRRKLIQKWLQEQNCHALSSIEYWNAPSDYSISSGNVTNGGLKVDGSNRNSKIRRRMKAGSEVSNGRQWLGWRTNTCFLQVTKQSETHLVHKELTTETAALEALNQLALRVGNHGSLVAVLYLKVKDKVKPFTAIPFTANKI
ncbi:S-adenosyl-L-methionine-dependentmethyltransferases superfamily protein [Striga asiatica]|uniref:S-adenosyl-L-methionine-dependentmethyltransferases superfamily protein n=1 Tax=Striga asiatica TaxID=4170 RepID=A0A5A7QCF6_STRAF|nr:S-adenosyl-L-methionine-dependentmethyltransferases superfamily protein [Striga asiatica]